MGEFERTRERPQDKHFIKNKITSTRVSIGLIAISKTPLAERESSDGASKEEQGGWGPWLSSTWASLNGHQNTHRETTYERINQHYQS
jgi:hypothetical protein